MSALRVFSIFIGIFSGIVGVVFFIMALVLMAAVAGQHLVFLHAAGAFLFAVVAAHLLPLTIIKTRHALVFYAVGAVVAAACFGYLYYFAELDDPFRSEGEMFANRPFQLAAFLCVFPLYRARLRSLALREPDGTSTPNQPLQPTAGRSDAHI
jgi:hypothetical protein